MRTPFFLVVEPLVPRDPYGAVDEHVYLLVWLTHAKEQVTLREEDGLHHCRELLQAKGIVPHPSEERRQVEDSPVNVVAELHLQQRRQLSLDLLLKLFEPLVGVPKEDHVGADLKKESLWYRTPVHVAAQHCFLLVSRIRLTVKIADEIGKDTHQACEEDGGNEQEEKHEDPLLVVLRRHVSVSHSRHCGQREVERTDIPLELIVPVTEVHIGPRRAVGGGNGAVPKSIPSARSPMGDAKDQEEDSCKASEENPEFIRLDEYLEFLSDGLQP
mmetsp:Transcript_41370/g.88135  ORF Transcript_41370/g.88135 Transcript_41370/m.88135 type:complete len:272 (+) Transcript_41370:1142-1957(+)